jgi:hypothetical protein
MADASLPHARQTRTAGIQLVNFRRANKLEELRDFASSAWDSVFDLHPAASISSEGPRDLNNASAIARTHNRQRVRSISIPAWRPVRLYILSLQSGQILPGFIFPKL